MKSIHFGAEENVFPLLKIIKYNQTIPNICFKAKQTIDLVQRSTVCIPDEG